MTGQGAIRANRTGGDSSGEQMEGRGKTGLGGGQSVAGARAERRNERRRDEGGVQHSPDCGITGKGHQLAIDPIHVLKLLGRV